MKKISLLLLSFFLGFALFAQELDITEHKEFPKTTRIIDAKFSSFRNYFATTKLPYTFEIYDRDWNQVFKHRGSTDRGAGEIAFSPDERYLAIGSYKGINDIALVRLKDMKVTQVLRGHSFRVNDIQFSYDNNFLATVSYDKKLIIWKSEGDKFVMHQLIDDYEDQVSHLAFSFDDKYLLTTDNDGWVRVYKFEKGDYKLHQKIKFTSSYIYGLDYHPKRHEFAAGSSSGLIRYQIHKDSFVPLDSIMKGLGVGNDINYSPAGDLLSIPHRQDIRILRVDEKEIKEIDGIYRHNLNTYCARFSNDGLYMATSSVDSSLIIWNISPVEASMKSQISSWVGNKLSLAQKKIFTHDVVNDLYLRVDKSMVSARDEFETSIEYEKRRKVLEEWTLSLIQKKTEEKYRIKAIDNQQVSIPLQAIIGYNADKQIYKIRFLETEAGVEIPISQARIFKENWEKASILANKNKKPDSYSSEYSNFQLSIMGVKGQFRVTPVENPFMFSDSRAAIDETTLKQTPAQTSLSLETESGGISHAILFASNVYESFSELINPVLDANTIAAELAENYGVQTEVLINPTLSETADKLREYASKKYSQGENLIVFFAGHGVYDDVFKEGYVISTDSRADDISKTSYLSHSNLRTMVNNIGCEHIFLVMDVCFGGTFDPHLATAGHRGAMEMYADIPRDEFIKRKTKYKTRLYLTSGGKEYVPDGRSGFHSPFARRFIEALRKYGGEDGVLTSAEILQYVEKVNPQPRFGEFGDNEPGSDFILISK